MESEVGHSIGRYDRHFNPRMSRTKFNFILWGAHYIPEMLPTQPQKPKSGGHPSIQHTPLSILLIASLISHVYSSNFILFMLVSFALTSFGKLPFVPYLFSQFLPSVFPLVFWVPLKHPDLSYVSNALEAGGFPLLFSSLDIFSLIFDNLCKDLIYREHIHCSLPLLSPYHACRFPPS